MERTSQWLHVGISRLNGLESSRPRRVGDLIRDHATLRLTLRTMIDAADTRAEVQGALIPIHRYQRVYKKEGEYSDQPVDGQELEWQVRLEQNSLLAGYTMNQCFNRIESVLLGQNANELRKILASHYGQPEAGIVAIDIRQIQFGILHGIFQIDVHLEAGDTISLVATVARDPIFNNDITTDYGMMKSLRRAEADHLHLPVESEEFTESTAIPPRFGCYRSEAKNMPAFYLAPFLDGAIEMNLKFKVSSRRGRRTVNAVVVLNGYNQNKTNRELTPEESSRMMSRIAAIQLRHSGISNMAFYTVMKGGDFLYDPETDHIYWHTYRDPYLHNSMQPGCAAFAEGSLEDRTRRAYSGFECQLLQLLDSQENSIIDGRKGKLHYVYSPTEIAEAIRQLMEESLIDKTFLRTVIDSLDRHFAEYRNQIGGNREKKLIAELQRLLTPHSEPTATPA